MEEQIQEKIKEFLEEKYYEKLVKTIEKGEKSLQIDYEDINRFDPALADFVLDEPDNFFDFFQQILLEYEEISMNAIIQKIKECLHKR